MQYLDCSLCPLTLDSLLAGVIASLVSPCCGRDGLGADGDVGLVVPLSRPGHAWGEMSMTDHVIHCVFCAVRTTLNARVS